jgi:hypothetical protein
MSQAIDPTVNEPSTPAGTFRFREAFEATADERAQVPDEDLVPINIDVGDAAHTVLTVVPRLAPLTDDMKALPVDHARIERLDVYARAAGHAHAVHVVASAPPEQLTALYEKALRCRGSLRSDVQNLINHGLVAEDSLSGIDGETGYSNVGYDLMSLVAIMRGAEERVKGRTATLPEDLDEAELVANQLLEMVALRDGTPGVPRAVALDRQRAFTLLVNAYDEARRAVHFLSWKAGNGNEIAPSLFANRSGRRKAATSDDKPSNTDVPRAPERAATNTTSKAPARDLTGLPGDSPFVDE